MKTIFYTFTVLVIVFSSCVVPKKYQGIKTIAILPVEVELIGHTPKNVSKDEETISKSIAYQKNLYQEISPSYKRRTRKYRDIKFQTLDSTSEILKKNNISNRDLLFKTPEKIAQILGVDAIIKTYVTEYRVISDEASMGIGAAKKIMHVITKDPYFSSSGLPNKTGSIKVACSFIFKGNTLWNTTYNDDTKWSHTPEEAFRKITYELANHFPL